ncbi:hypothetical protein CBF23_006175 [Marinomonas agarivorans]|nr:hypothetical protein CBF23_006175 [Marinomonas agarivorans]
MNKNNVVEQVEYRLDKAISEADFIALNKKVSEWAMQQAGFLYRSLTKSSDGKWIDIVYWEDMNTAQKAADAFPSSTDCQKVMPYIIKETVVMRHLDVVLEACHEQ